MVINTVITAESREASYWSFADLTPAKTQYLTHGYHRYPAKFIPQLVRRLIEEYSEPGERICDPFGGCGTTLVESKLAGRVSFGFDINPVAVMITRTKIKAIDPDLLSRRFAGLSQDIENGLHITQRIQDSRLDYDRLQYWFGDFNLQQLLSLKKRLQEEEEPTISRFFLCALSHILKNCSYWLTTSTKPQKDHDKIPESPIDAFLTHASRMSTL